MTINVKIIQHVFAFVKVFICSVLILKSQNETVSKTK